MSAWKLRPCRACEGKGFVTETVVSEERRDGRHFFVDTRNRVGCGACGGAGIILPRATTPAEFVTFALLGEVLWRLRATQTGELRELISEAEAEEGFDL